MIVVAVAVAFRLALPFGIKYYVNRELSRIHGYRGRIGDVTVHLWRGGYRVHNLRIVKTGGDVPVPFFSTRVLVLSVEWRELFHGAVVGQVGMDTPELNFVVGPAEEETQTGEGRPWGQTLERLFPFKLNRLQLHNGHIHFRNYQSEPPVDISMDGVSATATNLTNSHDMRTELPAGVQAQGTTIGGGGFELELHMNPLKKLPALQLSAQLTNVDLVALNDFLRAYGKFDVASGTFAIFTSFALADGNYDGYAKVFFNDLQVFAWDKERKKNILKIFWDAIVGTVSTVLRNQPKDQLATKIPISGSFQGQSVGIWTAAVTLLRNAFIRGLVPALDQPVTVKQLEREKR